jgi:hypothetical protein
MEIDEASNSHYFGEESVNEAGDTGKKSESVRLDLAPYDEEDVKRALGKTKDVKNASVCRS